MKINCTTFIMAMLFIGCKTTTDNSFEKPSLLTKQDSVMFRASPDLDRPHPSVIRVYEKLNFGNGYNSTTGQEYFGVLDFEGTELSTELAANARGNRGQVTMEIVTNKEQLKTALNISAKADLGFKMGAWNSQNSLKLSTMRNTEFNGFSQHAILKASYSNEPLVLIKPEVKKELIALAKKDPETFMRTCGDMFVSRIYTGGELYTLFSLNSRDTNEKTQNNMFFESTNEYLGNTLDVEFEAEAMNQSAKSIENINTTVITEGGGKTPATTEMSDFIQYANDFKEQVSSDNRAVILYVELSPYESIAGFPKIDFSKIRVKQRGVLEASSDIYYILEEDESNADFVSKHPELFKLEDFVKSLIVKQQVSNKMMVLQKIISDCQADPDYCNLSDLEVFSGHEPFNPHFILPEWEGTPTRLSIDSNEWKTVTDDTKKTGQLLSIQGQMKIRLNTTSKEEPLCRDGVIDDDYVPYGKQYTHTTGAWFWKKDHYRDIHKHFYYPYFKVRYISLETNQVVKEFNWTDALETEAKVKVEVQFVNPAARLGYWEGSEFIYLSKKDSENLGHDFKPRYTIVQSCDEAKPPTAIISPKNAPPKKKSEKPMMANSSDKASNVEEETPKVVKGDHGYYTYKYN